MVHAQRHYKPTQHRQVRLQRHRALFCAAGAIHEHVAKSVMIFQVSSKDLQSFCYFARLVSRGAQLCSKSSLWKTACMRPVIIRTQPQTYDVMSTLTALKSVIGDDDMASLARGIPITELPNELTKNIDVSTPIGECS